jgi:hypothetical protein
MVSRAEFDHLDLDRVIDAAGAICAPLSRPDFRRFGHVTSLVFTCAGMKLR